MLWKKIMCPVDYSPGSKEALRVAATMSAASGGELVIVHAWNPLFLDGMEFGSNGALMAELRKSVEVSLETWKSDAEALGAKHVSWVFVTGAPWNEIVSAAVSDSAVDLIVMGTHGRTGLKHVLIGSVAEKVVRHAPCPVLVVRTRQGA